MQLASPGSAPAEPQKPAAPGATPAVTAEAVKPEPVAGSPDDLALHAGGLRLPIHVNARGLSLGILATVAVVFALQWAQKFFVPLLLGIFIAYTLSPVVRWLERVRIPRLVGATIVTAALLGGMGATMLRLQDEFINILDELPTLTQKVSKLVASAAGGEGSTIQRVQKAAAELEQATANVGANPRLIQRRPTLAQQSSSFRLTDWLLAGSVGLAAFVTQATMVVFLVFFLLLAGDTFKRKLVKLTGPSLTRKKVTVHILDDINTSIQNYMFMLLVTNVLLALLMWVALRAIGLNNAGAWAIFAGVAHIMPYFGPLLITSATGLVAFMQFESLRMVILVAGASMGIATLVGMVVTTWMTGKIAKMNPAAVFVSLLFWGWLWGMWGLLLGVPVVVVLKVVAERVEGMEALAELLGE